MPNLRPVKLGYLVDIDFQNAINTLLTQNLSAKASFTMLRLAEEIKKNQNHYEEVRKNLLQKHGKKNEAGELTMNEAKTQYILDDTEGFNNDWKELAMVEVNLPELPLSYVENCNISPTLLQTLVTTVLNPDL